MDNWDNWNNDWNQNWDQNGKVDWGNSWEKWEKDWADWTKDWSNHWDDWTGNWDNQWQYQWNNKAVLRSSPFKGKFETERFKQLELREEEFGGILYDPQTEAVFKLDTQAYQTIKFLKEGKRIDDFSKQLKLSKKNVIILSIV